MWQYGSRDICYISNIRESSKNSERSDRSDTCDNIDSGDTNNSCGGSDSLKRFVISYTSDSIDISDKI